MLAARLGLTQRATLELGRAGVQRRARIGRVGEPELAARKRRVDPARGAVDRVALGHPARLPGGDQPPRLAREAAGDDLLLEAGADHRLAVDALDPELRDQLLLRRLGELRYAAISSSPSSSIRRTMPLPPRST